MLLFGGQNLGMNGGNVIILYNDSLGYVTGVWDYDDDNNISTALTDGYLEIGGTKVASFKVSVADLAVMTLADPSFTNTGAGPLVYEVDVPSAPTDIAERTDGGRDPDYEYES